MNFHIFISRTNFHIEASCCKCQVKMFALLYHTQGHTFTTAYQAKKTKKYANPLSGIEHSMKILITNQT